MKAFLICLTFSAIFGSGFTKFNEDHPTLAIGSPAPDFSLPGVNGKTYSIASFKNAEVLVIIFSCNHCPTAQAYEDRIIQMVKDYGPRNVAFAVISANDPRALRLDEMDFSDLGDSFEEMKIRAQDKHFNFPYLYDGETQAAAKAYGPVSTPHVFVFDKERKLRYTGRVDDTEWPHKPPQIKDARNAIEALLAKKDPPVQTTKTFGCSIKWSDKRSQVQQALDKWAKEPVGLDTIDEADIRNLVKNNSGKLKLINVWATWCGPCTAEFPEFISMNRMYRDRDFEFISISADEPAKQEKALKFLQKQQASCRNYIFSTDDKYKMIEAIDPAWPGALPYTLLVEPGGNIVYAKQGAVDILELKKAIVSNKYMGRWP